MSRPCLTIISLVEQLFSHPMRPWPLRTKLRLSKVLDFFGWVTSVKMSLPSAMILGNKTSLLELMWWFLWPLFLTRIPLTNLEMLGVKPEGMPVLLLPRQSCPKIQLLTSAVLKSLKSLQRVVLIFLKPRWPTRICFGFHGYWTPILKKNFLIISGFSSFHSPKGVM